MIGPVVLAHEEGDDVAGVPVTACVGCRCPLLGGGLCPGCRRAVERRRLRAVTPSVRGRLNGGCAPGRVLLALRLMGGGDVPAVAASTGLDNDRVSSVLWRLRVREYVANDGFGQWRAL